MGSPCARRSYGLPVRLSAPRANRLDLPGGDMEEFQKLLMLLRSALLELPMPAVHILIGETGGGHDGRPFLFGNHAILSPFCSVQQTRDRALVLPHALDRLADFDKAPSKHTGGLICPGR